MRSAARCDPPADARALDLHAHFIVAGDIGLRPANLPVPSAFHPVTIDLCPAFDERHCKALIANLYRPVRGRMRQCCHLARDFLRANTRAELSARKQGRKLPQPSLISWCALEAIWVFLGNEAGSQLARTEPFMLHNRGEKIDIVPQSLDPELVERRNLLVGCLIAGFAPCHQLGDHRVVEHRNFAAMIDAIIHPHAVNPAPSVGTAIVRPPLKRGRVFNQAAG